MSSIMHDCSSHSVSSCSSSSSTTVLPLCESHDDECRRSSALNYAAAVLEVQSELKAQTKNKPKPLLKKARKGLEESAVASAAGALGAFLCLIDASWFLWLVLALVVPALLLEVWEIYCFTGATAEASAFDGKGKPAVTRALKKRYDVLKARRARMQLVYGQGITMAVGWFQLILNVMYHRPASAVTHLAVSMLVWSLWTHLFKRKTPGQSSSSSKPKRSAPRRRRIQRVNTLDSY